MATRSVGRWAIVDFGTRKPVPKVKRYRTRESAERAMRGMNRMARSARYGVRDMQSENPQGIDRLKRNPNRLHDALIVVRGKKVKGKAKYDSKAKRVRVFVTPQAARRVNPYGTSGVTGGYFHSDLSPMRERAFTAKSDAKEYADEVRRAGWTARVYKSGTVWIVSPGKKRP